MRAVPDIHCLVLDVDGVLTDGRLLYGSDPEPLRAFHVQDGLGIQLFRKAAGEVVILTAKESGAVRRRAEDLGLRYVIQGSRDKAADLQRLLPELGLDWPAVAAMGDDLPDLPVMRRCGYALAPADAATEARAAADFIATRPGGRGAVREAIEHILRALGKWQATLEQYAGPVAGRS
jgi:3-deoxy-D-manno-octulosonate 8-phosphate phosphatase (KDO 8-P phosphatase)